MTHVQPSTAQPSTMPSPLLSLFVNYHSYGESLSSALSSGFVGAGMIHILDKLTKLQNMRFPKHQKHSGHLTEPSQPGDSRVL